MPKPKRDPDQAVARVCGNCEHIEFADESKTFGECYEAPPVVCVDDGEPVTCRPTVGSGERACARFKLRLQS